MALRSVGAKTKAVAGGHPLKGTWGHPSGWRPAQRQQEGDVKRQREEEKVMVSWFKKRSPR